MEFFIKNCSNSCKEPCDIRQLISTSASLTCLLVLSACNEPDLGITAKMNHDFNGSYELNSYQAKPKEEIGQAEQLAQHQYGSVLSNIKTPRTIFMCLWRNPKFDKSKSARPTEIFLSCSFAPSPIENPGSLLKMAELYNTIDRANLKAHWELKNGGYHLSRFEVEIQADGESYRSQNLRANMNEIDVAQTDMTFPQNANEPFQFALSSELPFRRNASDNQSEPNVSMSFSGMAEPIPNWVNY